MSDSENKELRDLLTHQAGMTNLHETRETKTPVQIDPPKNGPGPNQEHDADSDI
jgi:hypothetical protein